jgi:hypothetical protein
MSQKSYRRNFDSWQANNIYFQDIRTAFKRWPIAHREETVSGSAETNSTQVEAVGKVMCTLDKRFKD